MQSSKKQTERQLPNIHFIFLINTKSGGGWGKRYLQLKKLQYHFEFKKTYNVFITLIDLFDSSKKSQALQKAKKFQQHPNNDLRIIICGGDGTIIWGIEQCYRAGLNIDLIKFGCLPIGTGNDFSRTIGWGSDPLQFEEENLFPLKKRIIQWIQSETSKYDVWETQMSTYEKGNIFVVKNGEDFITNKKVHKTGFVNYVGIGIDARVSYNFQKHRTSTKLMNICVYVLFGCFLCCKNIPELSSAVDQFSQTNYSKSEGKLFQQSSRSPSILNENNLEDFMTQHLNQDNHEQSSRKIPLKKGYHGLICLNSKSYMAGALNAWETKKIAFPNEKNTFQRQSVNDGKIEFLGYRNEIILAMEKFFHTGSRVAQGQGPFVVRFKEMQDEQIQNYVQVDGQGLKFKGLKEVVIRRNENVPVINVMLGKRFK